MSKFVEVKVVIDAVVLVELEEHEGIDDALGYAENHFGSFDGDIEVELKSEPSTDAEIECAMRHADIKLML